MVKKKKVAERSKVDRNVQRLPGEMTTLIAQVKRIAKTNGYTINTQEAMRIIVDGYNN